MRLRHQAIAVAALVALASVLGSGAASAQRTVAGTRALVHVSAPGLYGVHLTITTSARRQSTVVLRVQNRALEVRAGGAARRLSFNVAVHGRVLAIRAADRDAALRLSIHVKRLRSLAAGKGATSGSAGGAATTGSENAPASPPVPASGLPAVAAPLTPASAAPGPPGDPASWQMIFDDEFNGSSLDTSYWSTGWFGSGITGPVNSEELECYDPSQVVEGGGELDLDLIAQSETCGGQTRPYTSGLISTNGKFTFTYGYVEVRAWLPGSGVIGDWPGIWTDGQSWPTDGELDLVEGLGGQACWHFHDPQGGPGGCEPGGSYTGGWHTYGADWEPGSVTYYYDGVEVGQITTAVTSAPMYLILNLAVDSQYGGPIEAPASMRVDYVRVWQH